MYVYQRIHAIVVDNTGNLAQTDRQTDGQTDRQADRQADRRTDRRAGTETDTQTDTQRNHNEVESHPRPSQRN